MRFTVCRIVGNELPPRDTPGSKLDCLKWLLDIDQSPLVRYVYVLNHIVDPDYYESVCEVLKGQEIVDYPFNPDWYQRIPDIGSKIHYAIGINEARNFGINYCRQFADYIACLDQECYIRPEEIPRVMDRIESDQYDTEYRKHYGLVSKRLHISNIPEDLSKVPDAEPMIIFNKDASPLFNPELAFGNRDKLELLEWMGYSVTTHGVRQRGDRARTVGTCIHMSFGDPRAEVDIHHRGNLRAASFKQLAARINEIYELP